MFDNVGEKIKVIAKVFFGIGCSFSLIGWIVALTWAVGLDDGKTAVIVVFGSFFVLAICVVLSWISSLLLYGFGVMIDNSERTLENTDTVVDLIGLDSRRHTNENL